MFIVCFIFIFDISLLCRFGLYLYVFIIVCFIILVIGDWIVLDILSFFKFYEREILNCVLIFLNLVFKFLEECILFICFFCSFID